MRVRYSRGFTLLESALAMAISIIGIIAAIGYFRQYTEQTRQHKAITILTAMRSSIIFYKQRCGNFPTLAVLATNNMSNTPANCNTTPPSRTFYGLVTTFPVEPYLVQNTVTAFTASNPVVTGTGGWLYDNTTGSFRVNLLDTQFGLTGTVRKLVSNPSTW